MDYGSASGSGVMLAMTGAGAGWISAMVGQLWVLAIGAAILVAGVIVIRTRFRRGKSPDEI